MPSTTCPPFLPLLLQHPRELSCPGGSAFTSLSSDISLETALLPGYRVAFPQHSAA